MLALALSFVSPVGAVVALAGVFALGVLVAGEQRLRRVCEAMGLRPPAGRQSLPIAAAVALTVVLVALAAAQPILAHQQSTRGRTDAEVYFVFDVSRSMAARPPRGGPSRLDRARGVAKEIRAGIADVPAGVTSLTDRLLPHLFPSVSLNAFNATVDRALGIDRPTARLPWGDSRGTVIGAVGELASAGYFAGTSRRRAVVVLTDGETLNDDLPSLAARLRQGKVRPLFVRLWRSDERIYEPNGTINPKYLPDPASGAVLEGVARSLETRIFGPGQEGDVVRALRGTLGKGPVGTRGRELQSLSLAPWLVGLAFLPLGFLLYRRNLPAATVSP